MADQIRTITLYQRRRTGDSVQRTITWERETETERGPMTHTDGIRTRLSPHTALLEAEAQVAAGIAAIVGLKNSEEVELSKVSWGDEDKNGDPRMAVTIIVQPEDAAATVAIPVNLKGGILADELLELEQRAFAFADLKELALGEVTYGDGDGESQPAVQDETPATAPA